MGPIQPLTVHLLLTDRLACPRCGPGFGLILLAHDIRNRLVMEGELGCSNCREKYPVRQGVADLRMPPRKPLLEPTPAVENASLQSEEAIRFAALMGVDQGPGTFLMKGPVARAATKVSALLDGIEIVALDPSMLGEVENEGVSRIICDNRLPFFSDSFRGVLLSGEVTDRDWEEAARVVASGGRVVTLQASARDRDRVGTLGLKVVLEEEGILVAQKDGPGTLPLVTLRGP